VDGARDAPIRIMPGPFDHPYDYGRHRGPMDREDRRTRMLLVMCAGLLVVVWLSYLNIR
jgi:hypothetical protein